MAVGVVGALQVIGIKKNKRDPAAFGGSDVQSLPEGHSVGQSCEGIGVRTPGKLSLLLDLGRDVAQHDKESRSGCAARFSRADETLPGHMTCAAASGSPSEAPGGSASDDIEAATDLIRRQIGPQLIQTKGKVGLARHGLEGVASGCVPPQDASFLSEDQNGVAGAVQDAIKDAKQGDYLSGGPKLPSEVKGSTCRLACKTGSVAEHGAGCHRRLLARGAWSRGLPAK
jgi:hypothetical protein